MTRLICCGSRRVDELTNKRAKGRASHQVLYDFFYPSLATDRTATYYAVSSKYRVILKKVSFGIFKIILVYKEDKNFTIESEGKGLSLSKFL